MLSSLPFTAAIDVSGNKGPEFSTNDSTKRQTQASKNKTSATEAIDVGHSVRQRSPPG